MRTIVLALLLCVASVASADDFFFVFEQGDFLGGYRERVYIKGRQALYVRQDGLNEEGGAKEFVPVWKTREVSDRDLQTFVRRLRELGAPAWKPQYPEDREGLICDGHSFYLAILGPGIEVKTEGACHTPEKFADFLVTVEALFP